MLHSVTEYVGRGVLVSCEGARINVLMSIARRMLTLSQRMEPFVSRVFSKGGISQSDSVACPGGRASVAFPRGVGGCAGDR